MVRLGRNQLCWCGSGSKYKNCHLRLESAQVVPPSAQHNVALRAWDQKECLHPEAASGGCNQIVSAHTIQRSRVLGRITDSTNHVRTFHRVDLTAFAEIGPRRVG